MPNITGELTFVVQGGSFTGAFSSIASGGGAAAAWYGAGGNFDASRSSSIYGNSDTVTPESLKTSFFIKF